MCLYTYIQLHASLYIYVHLYMEISKQAWLLEKNKLWQHGIAPASRTSVELFKASLFSPCCYVVS